MTADLRGGDQAFGTVAVGEFFENMFGTFVQLDAVRFQHVQDRKFIFSQKHIRTEKAFDQFHAVFMAAGNFPVAFQQGQAAFIATAPVT